MSTRCLRSLLGLVVLIAVIMLAGCGSGDKKPTPTPTLPPEPTGEITDDPTDDPGDIDDPGVTATPTPTDYPKREEVTYGEIEKLYPLYETAYDFGKKHGVTFYIADLVPDYVLTTMEAEQQTDYFRIYKTLNLLDKCLDLYPDGFFESNDGEENMAIYIVSHAPGFYSIALGWGYDDNGDVWEGFFVQADEEEMWDEYDFRFHYVVSWYLNEALDYYEDYFNEPGPYSTEKWLSFMPKDFAYLNDYDNFDKIDAYGEKFYPEYLRYYSAVIDEDCDRSYTFADLLWCTQNDTCPELSKTYLKKMGYLIECYRKIYEFDVKPWPSETSWEATYRKLCEKAGVEPGYK